MSHRLGLWEAEKRDPPRWLGSFRVRAGFLVALGGLLLALAVLKGHQLAYYGMPATGPFKSVELYVLLVVAEFLLGLWLLTGLYWKATRLVAILVFFVFLEAALWLALTGQRSCGCLGHIEVNPWLAVVVDLAILSGLMLLPQDGPERTLQTHTLTFCGFLLAALALGVPLVMTMAVYRCEASRTFSYDLRRDRLLHATKVAVELREPTTAHELVALVATRTGMNLSVDGAVREHLVACQPDWKSINHQTVRGWAALEAVSKRMPVPSRWIKTNEGYALIRDDPLRRAKHCWWAGLTFGMVGSCWLAWSASQRRAMAGTPGSIPGLPVEERS